LRIEPRNKNMQLQIAAATWRIQRKRLYASPNHFGTCSS